VSEDQAVNEHPSAFLQQTHWPVGEPVANFQPPPTPVAEGLVGHYGSLVPLSVHHAADLWESFALDPQGRSFTYLPYGPFADVDAMAAFLTAREQSTDPFFYTIQNRHDRSVGFGSYLRIDPAVGCIEIGHLGFSPALQSTTLATEVIYLMISWAFAVGYRRVEWKCDALNAASRQAALRFGFEFDGVFRQATMYKNRNRDTAWYAIIDRDWPPIKAAYEAWLAPTNFDSNGRQRRSLRSFR